MNYIGISTGFHDSAISLIDNDGEILWAGHCERYSRKKHDHTLHPDAINDMLRYTTSSTRKISYYENPLTKWLRQQRSGKNPSLSTLWAKNIVGSDNVCRMLGKTNTLYNRTLSRVGSYDHHLSHAAAQFQTSPYNRATVIVIDAIGEWDTITIWGAQYCSRGYAQYTKLWSKQYPDSIGLFYSAITQAVGLKPGDEEYILMGMAALGKHDLTRNLRYHLIKSAKNIEFTDNFHAGVDLSFIKGSNPHDIALATQHITEELIGNVLHRARSFNFSDNLVYGGGVALNCVANRILGNYFKNIWIMPNPGDAGSSLGAAALSYGRKINWKNAYLGYNIWGNYPVESLLNVLLDKKIVGVANGRSEWGPRALGNRSLLADPRGNEIKDAVNAIKNRENFRPFAPVILAEHATKYFSFPTGWKNSDYMQTVARCKYPSQYPAIVHVDNTSRVQTVQRDGSGIRQLLEVWYQKTGCPMLLNTSLNVKGEPMVNTQEDAKRWSRYYDIPVICFD